MAPPTIAVLHHLEDAFTGHAGTVLTGAGVTLVERNLRTGDPLPPLAGLQGIVSLGGDQSVCDIGRHRELQAEAALLREAVGRGIPVLGVCLGAQLLAHALGGHVRRLPRRMVTWTPLAPTPAAAQDPLMGELPAGAAGLHWNEDGLEPPPDAVELLVRPGRSAEAFRAGDCAWGVQFHPEVDAATLDSWYRDWPQAPVQGGVTMAQARAADARHLPGQHALSEALFGSFARVAAGAAV